MTIDRGTRVLLTGGAGMIGANLAHRLVAEGAQVCVLVRPTTNRIRLHAIEHQLEFLPADLTDAVAVREAVRRAQPQIVFHLASTLWARSSADGAATHVHVNVLGTLHLLEALREFPDTRVVFTGSSAAYGGGSRLREDHPLLPGTIYGASKASASLLLQAYARVYHMQTMELRLFMPYGPWEDPCRLIPHTVLSALAKRDVVMTRGDQQRDLVYVEDVVEALLLAAVRPVHPGSVFNIGSGIGTPVRQVVELILRLMGDPVKPRVGALPTRPDEIMELSADITAARDGLGWEPRISLDEGLRNCIRWFTEHPAFASQLSEPRSTAFESVAAARPCLVCGSTQVEPFLDLGATALANKFLTQEELSQPEPVYPLRVGFCHGCGHVQLMERVPPGAMFDDYLYVSSASDTLAAHLFELSDVVMARYGRPPAPLVIDIGCNDATLLKGFRRHGARTLGVDPAKNLAELTRDSGIERYVGFFSARTAREIAQRWGQAAVITATNTFPHIPALQDFVEGIKTVLAPEGVLVIEAHYLVDLLDQVAFDTIYHEHVSYWALGPMTRLFERNGMQIVDVERLPIHHGQLRVCVQHAGRGVAQPAVAELLELERARGLDRFDTYRRFAEDVQQLKRTLRDRLQAIRADGKRVVGYGAPAKGNTLLGFLELGPETLDYIVDRSVLKQGRYAPGTHIPIVAPERLLEDQPEYVLLLAWNFAEEVFAQQAEYRRRGGTFIVPVPEVRMVTDEHAERRRDDVRTVH